ncbi:MAG: metallophosphatase family protein [Brevinematales bacterium]|nr:metallophosphatase family protein [Brevinematales bacterium]
MVIAIFSDVHSNLEALETFFNETYSRVNKYICLGDIVGYGPDPSACINIVKSLCGSDWAIRGNHDRAVLNPRETTNFNFIAAEAIFWTIDRISEMEIEYLKSLSDIIDYKNYVFVHGSVYDPDEYVLTQSSANRNLKKLEQLNKRIMFFGHTHIPIIWSSEYSEKVIYNTKIYLDKNKLYLINPGSIGQPRDSSYLGSYLIFDDEEESIIFKRFQYDVDRTYKKIVSRGLPEYLGRRLKFGV